MDRVKIVVERHPDGFVAYPLGVRGVVVGQGDTAQDATANVASAIRFHLDTFGPEALDGESMLPPDESRARRCARAVRR